VKRGAREKSKETGEEGERRGELSKRTNASRLDTGTFRRGAEVTQEGKAAEEGLQNRPKQPSTEEPETFKGGNHSRVYHILDRCEGILAKREERQRIPVEKGRGVQPKKHETSTRASL